MRVHEIAARGRSITAKLRRPARGEIAEQGVVVWADGLARELDLLFNELVRSADARDLEIRRGTMSVSRRSTMIVEGGRVLHAGNLFKPKDAA
jgi:hypothetical protein